MHGHNELQIAAKVHCLGNITLHQNYFDTFDGV